MPSSARSGRPDNQQPSDADLPGRTGAIDANGEIRGFLDSTLVDYNGDGAAITTYESGNYYAIVSGTNAEEVVGIIVVESAYPGIDNLTVRETGGFILYR
ncbi:MAG: hypothetical protein IPL38_12045 [Rhodobacter sp.]|nr:hypothetical protein [Rhodobacter sp.]